MPIGAEVFLVAGARENVAKDGDIAGDIARFDTALRARNDPALHVSHVVLDDETHNSVFPAAVSRGLRVVFRAH